MTRNAKKIIKVRPELDSGWQDDTLHPLLLRVFKARGVQSKIELERGLDKLPSPWLLSGMETMVNHLVEALSADRKIIVVADFDADGATSCAVAVRGLRLLGAKHIDFIVPNRFEFGYGLTPEIVGLVELRQADIIITVDNGISSIEGIAKAKTLGIKVLVTDHHLPGKELPLADAIINPNLPEDTFPSKVLAGVGVLFYVLLALRARLRDNNWFVETGIAEPNLAQLLDFVALGTVADVVALDHINRILVHQGLARIRKGNCHPGIRALADVSGRHTNKLFAADLAFALAPRLNAAGRMDDMSLGIQCLLADDDDQAKELALQLDGFNNDRKEVESQMKQDALGFLADLKFSSEQQLPAGLCLFDENWHQGVVGLLASRIKDHVHRPVIAFAPAEEGWLKGSARSIAEVHIRDVLSDIAAHQPQLLCKFGGHAMAAGLSIQRQHYPAFALAFDEWVGKRLATVDLEQKIWSDGELAEDEMTLAMAELLQNAATWGHEFSEPSFHGCFEVLEAHLVKEVHLKLLLRPQGGECMLDAIAFFIDKPEQWLGLRKCLMAYKLAVNEYKGRRNVQLLVHYLEKVS